MDSVRMVDQTGGEVIEAANGVLMPNPHAGARNRALQQLMKIAVEFGLTASSKSRVEVAGGKQESALDIFRKYSGRQLS